MQEFAINKKCCSLIPQKHKSRSLQAEYKWTSIIELPIGTPAPSKGLVIFTVNFNQTTGGSVTVNGVNISPNANQFSTNFTNPYSINSSITIPVNNGDVIGFDGSYGWYKCHFVPYE